MKITKKIDVAICGATGYAGQELMRILLRHPHVRLTALCSQTMAHESVADQFPYFRGLLDQKFMALNVPAICEKASIVFLALPHQAAIGLAGAFLSRRVRVIDLSADFRLKDATLYKQWYGWEHKDSTLLRSAVYGLPEVYRDRIKKAQLVANPGCYPTSVLLGILPLLREKVVEAQFIIADSKSGVSGAGRNPSQDLHFPEVNGSFKAYKVGAHQHTPEMEQELSAVASRPVHLLFTAHLLPINRGILSTMYLRLKGKAQTADLRKIFAKAYKDEPFVRVYPEGKWPELKYVQGQNFCDIGVKIDPKTKTAIVITAIDNLVKGAAGQAVQNMNIMEGFAETEGLIG